MGELMGLGAVDWHDLLTLAVRLGVDLASVTVVTRLVYFRVYRNHDHLFTCFVFNVVTLSLCVLLKKGSAELGFALALFAVFGILRYRTEQIRTRDLTYLFLAIGLGLINGVANRFVSVAELLAVNAIVVAVTAFCELGLAGGPERSIPLVYDRLDLLQKRGPAEEAALIADLTARTGLRVVRVETQRVDLLRDSAEITVFCRP